MDEKSQRLKATESINSNTKERWLIEDPAPTVEKGKSLSDNAVTPPKPTEKQSYISKIILLDINQKLLSQEPRF
ncbi:unnamed protein product [Clavelina lepadiformis]|uniref:Uncharacterized protein n=1 Tax=Clavelina lepadiformis TaxID=159417 RepID=A0ABP0GY83_CLALP